MHTIYGFAERDEPSNHRAYAEQVDRMTAQRENLMAEQSRPRGKKTPKKTETRIAGGIHSSPTKKLSW